MNRKLKIGLSTLDEFDLPVKTVSLEATWTEDLDKELKEKFNVEFDKEVSVIITSELKNQITEDLVYNLIKGSI